MAVYKKKRVRAILSWLLTIVLTWGLVSCGDRIKSSESFETQLGSPTTGEKLTEVAPPEVIQQLGRKLNKYRPQVSILSPGVDRVLPDTSVEVKLQVRDLPVFKSELGIGPHLTLILDNDTYQEIYDLDRSILLKDVEPGTHTLRVFASRPWHESFKNEGAYTQTTFHILTKTGNNAPDSSLPLLTYNQPLGSYGAEPILLDFYLTNAPLHLVALENPEDEIADWRIRVTVNGQSFLMDTWEPIYLKGFHPGQNWVQIEFLDEQGQVVVVNNGTFNNTVKLISYEPNGADPLSQLIRGEISTAIAQSIVDPNYQPEPVPQPEEVPETIPETTEEPTSEETPAVIPPPSEQAAPPPVVTPETPTEPETKPEVIPPSVVKPEITTEETPTEPETEETPAVIPPPSEQAAPTPVVTPETPTEPETKPEVIPPSVVKPEITSSTETEKSKKGFFGRLLQFFRKTPTSSSPEVLESPSSEPKLEPEIPILPEKTTEAIEESGENLLPSEEVESTTSESVVPTPAPVAKPEIAPVAPEKTTEAIEESGENLLPSEEVESTTSESVVPTPAPVAKPEIAPVAPEKTTEAIEESGENLFPSEEVESTTSESVVPTPAPVAKPEIAPVAPEKTTEASEEVKSTTSESVVPTPAPVAKPEIAPVLPEENTKATEESEKNAVTTKEVESTTSDSEDVVPTPAPTKVKPEIPTIQLKETKKSLKESPQSGKSQLLPGEPYTLPEIVEDAPIKEPVEPLEEIAPLKEPQATETKPENSQERSPE
ncbi:hypothetical protein [Oscillatoria salina]|uniref:hypothetical protein n=1 Tax=Oscillatoria salina TaxID=331517 RepID=UPI001CCCFF18|nr:hypothetical protein [Oscillatoria salina]